MARCRQSLLIALPAVVLLAAGGVPPSDTAPEADCARSRTEPGSAKECAKCHAEFYEEWRGRAHANAWTDPIFQAALADKRRPEACYPCHIPDSVLDRLGRRPQVRDAIRDEGVTCVSCHLQEETIHGPFGAATDAHPSGKHEAFTEQGSTHLCASCHSTKIGPVLPLGKDFEEAKLSEEGKSCVGCHMPEVERHLATSIVTGKPVGDKRTTRRHTVLGPGDPEFCIKAFKITARQDGAELVVAIANHAGHRVPGLTLRKFPVSISPLDADGKPTAEHRIEISSDNGLAVAETREFRFPHADGIEQIEVEIHHVLADHEPQLVGKSTLEVQ